MNLEKTILELREVIKNEVILTSSTHKITVSGNRGSNWIFDFRKIFLNPSHINMIADIFLERYKDSYPFQVGGLETASIPLITAIVVKSHLIGMPVSGFYIRKSRKNVGLQNNIEGQLNSNPIILVDDLINFGNTFQKQVKILEDLNRSVSSIFTLVRFREISDYKFLSDKNIVLNSIFSLKDFYLSLEPNNKLLTQKLNLAFKYKAIQTDYYHTAPKSMLVINEKYIYLATDYGSLIALDINTAQKKWEFSPLKSKRPKKLFFSPVTHAQSHVFFTNQTDTLYALNAENGELMWKFEDSDKITCPPLVSKKYGLLFIGVLSGIFWKKGAVLGLDIKTGEIIWEFSCKNEITSQPAYSETADQIIFGDETGMIISVSVTTKKERWRCQVDGINTSSFLFPDKQKVMFGTQSGFLYTLNVLTGQVLGKIKVGGKIWNTPTIYGNNICFSSSDKGIYSFSIMDGKLNWFYDTPSRVYASPVLFEGKLLVGSSDGQVLELDSTNGVKISEFQCSEGIADNIQIHGKTIIVPTVASEVYLLN